jgi:hypothetical protein
MWLGRRVGTGLGRGSEVVGFIAPIVLGTGAMALIGVRAGVAARFAGAAAGDRRSRAYVEAARSGGFFFASMIPVFAGLGFPLALVFAALGRTDASGIERRRIARREAVTQLVVNLLFFVLWFSVGAQVLRFHVLFLRNDSFRQRLRRV